MKNSFLSISILLIIILCIYYRWDVIEFFNEGTTKVCSNVNGGCYYVQTKFNPETFVQAADALDTINKMNLEFFEYLKKKYLESPPNKLKQSKLFKKRQTMVRNLIHRYNPNAIMEHMPLSKKNTSYVFAKGERIGYCLREKRTGENHIHKLPVLYFVNLHELSHLAATEYNPGHDERFWSDFKFILKEAMQAGLYTPIDYDTHPVHYCGIEIFYNPLYDPRIT